MPAASPEPSPPPRRHEGPRYRLGTAADRFAVGDLDLHGFFGLDDSTRPGFRAVRLLVSVRGPEPPERYGELRRAVDQHCPVLDIVTNPVPVERTMTIAG